MNENHWARKFARTVPITLLVCTIFFILSILGLIIACLNEKQNATSYILAAMSLGVSIMCYFIHYLHRLLEKKHLKQKRKKEIDYEEQKIKIIKE